MGSLGNKFSLFCFGVKIEDFEGHQFLILGADRWEHRLRSTVFALDEAIGIGAFHRTWRVTSHMPWISKRAMPPKMVRCPPSPCPRQGLAG